VKFEKGVRNLGKKLPHLAITRDPSRPKGGSYGVVPTDNQSPTAQFPGGRVGRNREWK